MSSHEVVCSATPDRDLLQRSIEREGHKIRIKKPVIEDRIRRGDKVTDTGIQRVGPRARLHGMSGTMVVLAERNAQ